jgi:SAM-dependent methyltransferase
VVGVRHDAVAWHDVECASYEADLPVWTALAAERGDPVLDLGCGTGRVALHLAELGHPVTGVDSEPDLVRELSRRARARGLEVDAVAADVRSLALEARFALAIAPMQVAQLLGGRDGRRAMLDSVSRHLAPGGVLAIALADPFEGLPAESALPPLPDVREEDGWVLSSTPTAVRGEPGVVAVDRLRQAVSPSGELSESLVTVRLETVDAEGLEREAAAAGFSPGGRHHVPETADHVGSTVVVLEAG